MSWLDVDAERARWIRVRMGLLFGVVASLLGLIVSAGFRLMVEDGPAWRELAETQRQRRLHVSPKRGGIYDRNGSAMAVSVEVPSVSLDAVEMLRGFSQDEVPRFARDAAERIAKVLLLDAAFVEKKILSRKRFTWLKRQISADEADAVRQLSADQAGEKRLRGLVVEGEGRRYYPRRELAGPLLGFVAPDGEGKDGIEYSLNTDLKGQAEQLRGLRDRSGRLIFSEGITDDRALSGHNIYLTIDQGIQFVAERELAAAVRTFEASGGSVVVVDPNTGELLALASYPVYNPNDYGESEPIQRRMRGVSDVFEPGSTAKIFTVAAGLAENVIKPTEKLYCEKGFMRVDNVVITDTHPAEWLPLAQVLAVSSNICAAKIGLMLGETRLYDALRKFGFGQESELPLPGEASGTLRPRGRPWVPVETAAASFGQGVSITSLQLAMATAAIANGGELLEPVLVKKVTTGVGEVVRETVPHVRRRVVPAHVARTVAELLVGVTEDGTGVEAAIDGYRVAGKTGTAQKTDPLTGRYSIDRFSASFVGFVPADKPVVAIAVIVDEPMVEHAGGTVAAPIFRRVAQMSLKYRGLSPRGKERVDVASLSREPDPAHAAYEYLRFAQGLKPAVQEEANAAKAVPAGKVRLPNMTGWPLRQVLKTSVELGIVPEIRGTGLLAVQTPGPGQVLEKGMKVVLEFQPAS